MESEAVSREVWSARRPSPGAAFGYAATPERARSSATSCAARPSGGGIALVAAAVAVIWANSPWGASYDAFRHWQLGSLVSAVLGALMLGHRDRFHRTP